MAGGDGCWIRIWSDNWLPPIRSSRLTPTRIEPRPIPTMVSSLMTWIRGLGDLIPYPTSFLIVSEKSFPLFLFTSLRMKIGSFGLGLERGLIS